MDKNTIIGWVLIGLIFIGWMTMTNKQAQKEQQAQQKAQKEQVEAEKAHAAAAAVRDSMSADELALLKQNIEQFGGDSAKIAAGSNSVSLAQGQLEGTLNVDGQAVDVAQLLAGKVASTQVNNDALKALRDLSDTYGKNGPLASKLKGTNQIVKLKNDSLEIEISSKGGMITRATLLGWPSANLDEHHKLNTEQKHLKPVELFSPSENSYSFVLNTNERRYDTKDFYFTPRQLNDTTVEMDLNMPGNAMFGIRYTLAKGGNYMVRMELVQRNMEAIVPTNVSDMDFNWHQKMGRHEEGKMFEERNSTIYYQYAESDGGGDVKYLPETSAKEEDMQDRLKWISTKGQFFSAVLIADNSFVGARLKSVPTEQGTPEYQRFLKNLSISSSLDYKSTVSRPASFFFYFGPNRYRILSHYKDMMAKHSSAAKNEAAYNNLELTRLIPLGWTLFRWINTYAHLQELQVAGSDAHLGARHPGHQREVSRSGQRHEAPAEDDGPLQPGRSQPHGRLLAHAAAISHTGGRVCVLPLVHRAARAVVLVGPRPVGPRCHRVVERPDTVYHQLLRQPHQPVLPAHDSNQHHLHLLDDAVAGTEQLHAGHEVDDVSHAGVLPGILQQLCSRPELLLLCVAAHHHHPDLCHKSNDQGGQGEGSNGGQCQEPAPAAGRPARAAEEERQKAPLTPTCTQGTRALMTKQ